MKLAAIILDALDPENMRALGMERLQERYREQGQPFTCTTLPNTKRSNPMIWGGFQNETRNWIDPEEPWDTPARHIDGNAGERLDSDVQFYDRTDFDETFIWDVLDHHGYDAAAIQIPITLPPYSFNTVDDLDDEWFPHTTDLMEQHNDRMPEVIGNHVDADYDFIGASIHFPDKWLHSIAEGVCGEDFIMDEAERLDRRLDELLNRLERNGYEWMIFGDHGSPDTGSSLVHTDETFIARHKKESVMISSLSPPTYMDELYEWFLDVYDVEDVGAQPAADGTDRAPDAAIERLEQLGYK